MNLIAFTVYIHVLCMFVFLNEYKLSHVAISRPIIIDTSAIVDIPSL